MSFWSFITVLAILSLMFGALYLSKFAADKEQAELDKKKKIRELRNELVDIDEILNTLLVYDRNPELLNDLCNRMEQLINEGFSLLPNSSELQADLDDLNKIKATIQTLLQQPSPPETPASDRQIFILKKHFARTIRLIKSLQAEGYIDELNSGNHRARLIRNSLMLEVKAYEIQGDQAKEKGEISSAANFYKHAKEMMVDSDLKFPDKINHIQTISKKISGLYITLKDDAKADNPTQKKE